MPAGRNVPKMVLLSGFRVMETGQQHKITEKLPKISFTILNRGIQDYDALMLQNVKEWMDSPE